MQKIQFVALTTETTRHYQAGGDDAYGQKPLALISDGSGAPCRHCLSDIEKNETMLLLAHSPFDRIGPFRETGPIFVHARKCQRQRSIGALPTMFTVRDKVLIRGYTETDAIYYGTGEVISTADLVSKAAALLENPKVAYLHVRSSTYNCFSCRIERAELQETMSCHE